MGQVANPVRWDLCMDTFKELGVTALLELPASSCAATCPSRLAVGVPAPMTFDSRSTTASASPARTARRTARLPRSLVRP